MKENLQLAAQDSPINNPSNFPKQRHRDRWGIAGAATAW